MANCQRPSKVWTDSSNTYIGYDIRKGFHTKINSYFIKHIEIIFSTGINYIEQMVGSPGAG